MIATCSLCLAVSVAIAGQLHAWTQPAETETTALVRSLDYSLNAHDANSVLDLLGEGATVQDDRYPQTRQQIRGWVEELIRQQVHVELIDQPTITHAQDPHAPTQVAWRATLDLHMYRALGLSFVPAMLRARLVDGTIVFVSIRPNPDWVPTADAQT